MPECLTSCGIFLYFLWDFALSNEEILGGGIFFVLFFLIELMFCFSVVLLWMFSV